MPHLAMEPLSLDGAQAYKVIRPGRLARDTQIHKSNVLGSLPVSYLRCLATKLQRCCASDLAEEVPATGKACYTHASDEHLENGLGRKEDCRSESFTQNILGQLGPETRIDTYASLLRLCTKAKAISDGERVHEHLTKRGYGGNTFLANLLVQMYSKCGSIGYAHAVFDKIVYRNLYSWTIMIAGCVQNGQARKALQLFGEMQSEGLEADKITFVCILNACASTEALEEGREMHAAVTGNGWESEVVVGTALVNMYGKGGCLDDATTVFDAMQSRDVVSWNAMMSACAQNGHSEKVQQLFSQMQAQDFQPNKVTFSCVLDAFASVAALEEGQEVHATVAGDGLESDVIVASTLINMYSKCNSLNEARAVFAEMPMHDVVSWSAMMASCMQNGHGKDALELFGQMQEEGLKPDKITITCVLDACAIAAALEDGLEIHAIVAANRWETDVVVGDTLINMYGKCGSLDDAAAVFAEMPLRDVVSWNVIMAACAQNWHGKEAVGLLSQMQVEGFEPNKITFICIFDACASVAALEEGRETHTTAVGKGWDLDIIVGSTLINMYGKCGSLHDARAVFAGMPLRDVVSWRAMMAVCAQNGNGKEALQLFGQMHAEGFEPSEITCICILDVCATMAALEEGRGMHATIAGEGWESDFVVGNALVNLYGKCGNPDDARAVFAETPRQEVSSWNAMMAGYTRNGQDKEALQLFGQMQAEGFEPDKITLTFALDACASVVALQEGQSVHATVTGDGWELDVVIGNSLINMYSKCGSLDNARAVFTEMPLHDVVSWNTMMACCAQNGLDEEALQLFGEMQAEGFQPNKITFICILTACNHTGLVGEGKRYFASMIRDYGISPSAEQYACMVDLLGRGGLLEEAEDLILSMPFEHVASAWLSLLSSCRIHRDVERAERAAHFVSKLDPLSAAPYVLLSNIHANAGRLDAVANVKNAMIDHNLSKLQGGRCIDVVHEFVYRETALPQQEEINV